MGRLEGDQPPGRRCPQFGLGIGGDQAIQSGFEKLPQPVTKARPLGGQEMVEGGRQSVQLFQKAIGRYPHHLAGFSGLPPP